MADENLITKWLLDAEDEAGAVVADQIAWLREERKRYSQLMTDGDWAVTGTSDEGGSGTATRGISAKDNHDAIVGALRKLGATDLSPARPVIISRFTPAIG